MIRLPRKTLPALAQLKRSRAQFEGNKTYRDNKRSHRLPCVDELAESNLVLATTQAMRVSSQV